MLRVLVRAVLAVLVCVAGTALGAVQASAEGCRLVEVHLGGDKVKYETVCPPGQTPGDGTPATGGPAAGPTCDLSQVEGVANYPYCVGTTACAVNNPSELPVEDWPMAEQPTPEHIYTFTWCETADGTVSYYWAWWLPADLGPSVTELAQQAFGELAVPAFTVSFNPPGRAVVGVPTWFWAAAGGGVITGSSALGVVAIGTPAYLELDPGDGSRVLRCPFAVDEGDACRHTYERSSVGATGRAGDSPAYTARARLVYDVSFENAGTPLELPGLPTSLTSGWATTAVPVAEIQAVVGEG